MVQRTILYTISSLLLITILSCGNEAEVAKSMEQLHKENGVPVKIEIVVQQPFAKETSYHAAFSGIEETSVFASFGGRVEKIYAEVGDDVKKDQLIVCFPKDNPSANYYQAKTNFENAKLAYERLKNLKKTGGVSQQSFDNVEAQYNVAKANWDVVRKSVEVIAPISGIISKISVSEAENVKREAELFTISQLNKLKTKVWITEKEIYDVKEGLTARAIWRDMELKGKVERVDMAMNVKTQAFGAMVVFNNPQKHLLLGLTAEVRIQTYQNPRAIVVNRKNIQSNPNGDFVFIHQNGVAKRLPVKLGTIQGLQVEVVDGLTPGDELIVEGLLLIENDTKIKIVE